MDRDRRTPPCYHLFFGEGSFVWPIFLRTLGYVAVASVHLPGRRPTRRPYFVARFAGRRKGLFLALLIAPFWISYMMRMLAWIDLLQTDGYINKALLDLHLIAHPSTGSGVSRRRSYSASYTATSRI